MDNQYEFYQKVEKKKWVKKLIFLLVIIFIIFPITFFFAFFFITDPTENFPTQKYFDIKQGMTVKEIGEYLEKEEVIKSALVFNILNKFYDWKNDEYKGPRAGKYSFKNKLDIFEVHEKLIKGESGIKDLRITIIEGEANFVIAKKFSKKFKNITEEDFLEKAKDDEGYLYPDTYFFSPFSNTDFVIKRMKENFYKKNKDIIDKIKKSDKSLSKLLIMASIIEKEAGIASLEKRKEVSGILWNRIRIGKPLQVDVVFPYIFKEHLPRILHKHLKVKSPYNLYLNKGLPPTAISNPTTKSLEAALYYTNTKNLFFLVGLDGKFYYAKTYAQHLVNKKKYLDNYKK